MSVIIPTFNRSALVVQAIDSVLKQTCQDFEILVVDDGSTDDTADVVRAFAAPQVRYLSQQNAGRSAARNRGLAEAKGEFIGFLDDDDLYLPRKLAWQVGLLRAQPSIDLVVSGVQIIEQDGALREVMRQWEGHPYPTLETCLYVCPFPTCSVLVRRQAVDRLDHWFDPEMDLAEDTDFFVRLLATGCRAAWLPAIVSARRLHHGNATVVGSGYSRAHGKILDKLFSDPALSSRLGETKDHLYAHHYVVGACHSYAAEQVSSAQRDLLRALALRPEWADGNLPEAVERIAGFARTRWVTAPREYIGFVFGNLPDRYRHLSCYRGKALGVFYMGRASSSLTLGWALALRDWLLAICHDPSWLRKRRGWAIMRQIVTHPLLLTL